MNLMPVMAKVSPRMQMAYRAYMPEIMAIRRHWADIRKEMKVKGTTEHGMLCRDLHPVEREILGELVPDLNSRDGHVKLKAIKWILRQPWGEDFKPAPIEKKFKGLDLGSVRSA